MARPSHWNAPTESVRLPAHLIPRLVEIAKTLDQPLPEPADSSEFQEYASFVQNSVKPKMLTVRDSEDDFKEHNYIIQAEPLSFAEWKQLQQISERIEQEILAGLSSDERLYLFSLLAQEVFPEHQPTGGESRV